MLQTLLLRLRACRHPVQAWLTARLATPAAQAPIDYWANEQTEGRI